MDEYITAFIGFFFGILFCALAFFQDTSNKIEMCEQFGIITLGNTVLECSIKNVSIKY